MASPSSMAATAPSSSSWASKLGTRTPPPKPSQSRAIPLANLLISPVEEPVESFSKSSPTLAPLSCKPTRPQTARPPSPPISPWTRNINQPMGTEPMDASHSKDPIVIPDVAFETPSRPLFQQSRATSLVQDQIITDHMSQARRAHPDRELPTRQEYELMCTAIVMPCQDMWTEYFADTREYLRARRAELAEQDAARKSRHEQIAKEHSKVAQVPRQQDRPYVQPRRHIQPKPLAARASSPAAAATTVNIIDAITGPRHPIRVEKPKKKPQKRQPSKSVPEHPGAPETSEIKATDDKKPVKDWASLPDYCPPLESFPSPAPTLKLDWKGTPSDLRNDPLRHLLHPAELQVASTLKLDCATYLTTKRLIFIGRLKYYHDGKVFKKTHAQKAGNIDVNKASRLHTAFDTWGWFHRDHFKNFPRPNEP